MCWGFRKLSTRYLVLSGGYDLEMLTLGVEFKYFSKEPREFIFKLGLIALWIELVIRGGISDACI